MYAAAPDLPGSVQLKMVCQHPGALHVVDTAGAAYVSMHVSTVTQAEVQWLELVGEALKLCDEEVAPVDWGTERGTTRSRGGAFARLPDKQMQPVWRPTSSAPLWVCPEHAAHYRTRASGAAKKVIQQ